MTHFKSNALASTILNIFCTLLLALVLVLGVMLEDVPESVSAAPLLPDARSSTVRGASAGG